MMKSLLTVLAALLLLGPVANAQTKVATYAYGKPGTAAYEQLSFWVREGRRSDMYYATGKDRREVKLTYSAKTPAIGKAGFKAQLANGQTLAIVPVGTGLQVSRATDKAPKTFAWEYEGPVNGVGTFCRECAENKEEAMRLLQAYYLK